VTSAGDHRVRFAGRPTGRDSFILANRPPVFPAMRDSLVMIALATLLATAALSAQQLPDTAFRPAVTHPTYEQNAGPVLCLDEAHHNFHTLDNRFYAFGALARRDGYRVVASRQPFTVPTLASCKLLVISNAQWNDTPWNRYPSPTPSAFEPAEIDAVGAWIAKGGALLLIADHMPLAGAASALAASLGVAFTDGFAVRQFGSEAGRDSSFATPTLFRPDDGTLEVHAITRGREAGEAVTQVRSFTGQAFRPTATDVQPVLVLPRDFVSLEPRIAWQFSEDTPKRAVGGWLQGATRRIGRGRVAFFGEAAMFSAQVAGPSRRPMGMNAPLAEQNAQFVLNTLHWLSGVLDR